MRFIKILAGIGALTLLALPLAGCATVSGSTGLRDEVPIKDPPIVKEVSTPYADAMACVARIPVVRHLKIGVGDIRDLTGKVNTSSDDATGDFVTQGASQMMYSALGRLGVELIDIGADYKNTVDWFGSKGSKGRVAMPQFMVGGAVDALDFGQTSSVFQAQLFGFGPNVRAYAATGRMDLHLTTLPEGSTVGGEVAATSSFAKVFLARQSGAGGGTFVGAAPGLTFASFQIGSEAREPMQETIGFMTDFGATDLVLKLLSSLHAAPPREVAMCRKLLVDPHGPAARPITLASAK
ncbi:MAG TPA: hypothetical protein VFL98_02935 [Candidatus Paceibacterota bacterium]|nr:hypothetical protein [Candidatus Paceibacterota bacterium]